MRQSGCKANRVSTQARWAARHSPADCGLSVRPETIDVMTQSSRLDPPRESAQHAVAANAAEAAASLIPVVGGPLSVVVATLFGYSYQKRLEGWRDEVVAQIRRMHEERGIAIEDLASNPDFLDAVATATRIAEVTSSSEKRRYLANALFNVGAGTRVGPDKQAIYLRYVEELTPSHMTMLGLLDDPPKFLDDQGIPWPNIGMGGLGSIVELGLPELYADKPLLETIIDDLQRYGLAQNPGLNTIMTGEGLKAGRGTAKGREFVEFISSSPAS